MAKAQQSIAHIRATAYYELVSTCIIRSEFEEAEQHLDDLVSFLRAPIAPNASQVSMWDQYASRVTLLYGHLAHALGQSQRALDCYRIVCLLEEEGTVLWTMGRVGEILLRIGAAATREQEQGNAANSETVQGRKHENAIWRTGEREQLIEMAGDVVDRCLNGGLGEHIAVVGRLIAASLSAEIVRAKYVFSDFRSRPRLEFGFQAKPQERVGPLVQEPGQLFATLGPHVHRRAISLHPHRVCFDDIGDL